MVQMSFHQLEENEDGLSTNRCLTIINKFDYLAKSEIVQEVNGVKMDWLYWDICTNMTDTL